MPNKLSFHRSHTLVVHERVDQPTQVPGERRKVEHRLVYPLLEGELQVVVVHDGGRVVQPRVGHHRPVLVPPRVVADQRAVEEEGEPAAGGQEQQGEAEVGDVLGEDQGVQVGALVDGVLVLGLELVEGDDLPDGEEEEEAG